MKHLVLMIAALAMAVLSMAFYMYYARPALALSDHELRLGAISPNYSGLPIGTCTLTEGLGAEFGKLGVTTQQSVGKLPVSVTPIWERRVLQAILVAGGTCKTSKGIGIGDDQGEVERLYGRGRKTVVYLQKGQRDRLGPFGDYFLVYQGVAFVIAQHKVVAILVRPNSAGEDSVVN